VFAVFLLGIAQSASADECQTTLAALRWTLTEPDSSWQLDSRRAGEALLGKVCDPEFLKSWFSTAGWTLLGDSTREPAQFGPTVRSYWEDRGLAFCLPREWPWRWMSNPCSSTVGISMFEGRITFVSAGATGIK
jgi:hypothetical protein